VTTLTHERDEAKEQLHAARRQLDTAI
jgi:hypothetical protein